MSGKKLTKKEKSEVRQIAAATMAGKGKKQRTLAKPKKSSPEQREKSMSGQNITAEQALMMAPGAGQPQTQQAIKNAFANAALAHSMALLNPWDDRYNGAKVPSDTPIDSAIFKTHEVLVVGCPILNEDYTSPPNQNFSGFGAFVIRWDALFRQYQYTAGTDSLGFDNSVADSGLTAISTPGNQAILFTMMSSNADDTVPGPLGPEDHTEFAWLGPMAAADIQLLNSKFRVSSAGCVFTYIGPEVTKSGELALGCVPYDQLESINVDIGGGTTQNYYGISWENFINLKGTVTVPAAKGGHLRYMPLDERAFAWRETVLSFSCPEINGNPPDRMFKTASAWRRNCRNPKFQRKFRKGAAMAGVNAELREDGTIKIGSAATIVRTIGANGKVTSETVIPDAPPPKPTPKKDKKKKVRLGNDIDTTFSVIPWFHGQVGDGEEPNPQPEDCTPDTAKAFIEALLWGGSSLNSFLATGFEPSADSINDLLNLYQDTNWHEGADLGVVMWNNIAPADAILQTGETSVWAGNLFQVDKYVNYECILDLNALTIGNMPPSPGVQGSASASLGIAKAVAPPAAGGSKPPTSDSWLTKIGNYAKGFVDNIPKYVGYGKTALSVAESIADVLAMF